MDKSDISAYMPLILGYGLVLALGLIFQAELPRLYKWDLEQAFKEYYNGTVADVYVPPAYAYVTICLTMASTGLLFLLCAAFKSQTNRNTLNVKMILREISAPVVDFSIMFVSINIVAWASNIPRFNFLGFKRIICEAITSRSPATDVSQLCQLFPSIFCATMTFCPLYLYFYASYLKIDPRIHVVRHFVGTLMCSFCFAVLINLYKDGTVYSGDIWMGVLIGAINVAISMRTKKIQLIKIRMDAKRARKNLII